jgi:hypothetical protein
MRIWSRLAYAFVAVLIVDRATLDRFRAATPAGLETFRIRVE